MTMIVNLLRRLATEPADLTGRTCRSCRESIPKRDDYGLSEGVCNPCRLDSRA